MAGLVFTALQTHLGIHGGLKRFIPRPNYGKFNPSLCILIIRTSQDHIRPICYYFYVITRVNQIIFMILQNVSLMLLLYQKS